LSAVEPGNGRNIALNAAGRLAGKVTNWQALGAGRAD